MGEREDLVADLRERARYFAALTDLGVERTAFARPAAAATAPAATAVRASGDAAAALESIRADLGDCRRCKLYSTRRNIVFGQGSPNARLMFIGEAPGADEDEQGLAFVGKAGQLLTKIIEAPTSLGMRREDVFITNILKSRPPENRNPEPDEILACQGFLDRQIEAIRPAVIVALGKFAAHWLLKTAEPISRLRGRMGQYMGIPVMPTYHPAYLLRTPSAKRDLWEDMKVVRAMLNG